MKIAMIFHSLNVPGGSVSVFLSLALALQEAGHDVKVFCYYFDSESCFPELNKKLKIFYVKKIDKQKHRINNNSIFIRLSLGFDYYVNARKIYHRLKKFDFDVILASEASAYVPALMYKAKTKANTKVVWSVFDPISLVDDQRPGLITHKHGWFKTVLSLHNIFDSRAIRQIDKVIVPTRKMKSQLDSFYGINCQVFPTAGIRSEDMKGNYLTIAEKRLKNKFAFQKKSGTILLSNGHFLPHRRYEDVLYALTELRKENVSLKYIISGSSKFDPSYFEKIKKLIQDLKLDDVVILDDEFKSNQEIIGYYQYCDIFLFVSVEQTWGLAPFEAMACHKPVIISNGVGAYEVLTYPRACVVEQKSPNEIGAALKQLISDSQYYNKIAQTGFQFIKDNFEYKKIARALIRKFEEL